MTELETLRNKFAQNKKLTEKFKEELDKKQKIQINCAIDDSDYIDKEKLNGFLNTVKYPLYFLDFETYQSPIPIYLNMKPFSQTPFQFSIHKKESPTSKIEHFEFLADETKDPREILVKKLISYIPKGSCTMAYNAGFERGIIRKLSNLYPEYSEKLSSIENGLIDLLIPFRNYHYYSNNMRGSYSIKTVLPALIPELSYKSLDISNGVNAAGAYRSLKYLSDQDKKNKIKQDLLNYCKLDTLAMVKILDNIYEILKK